MHPQKTPLAIWATIFYDTVVTTRACELSPLLVIPAACSCSHRRRRSGRRAQEPARRSAGRSPVSVAWRSRRAHQLHGDPPAPDPSRTDSDTRPAVPCRAPATDPGAWPTIHCRLLREKEPGMARFGSMWTQTETSTRSCHGFIQTCSFVATFQLSHADSKER